MKNNIKGFIAVTSVLILSAFFLSLCITIASRAISNASVSVAFIEREKARFQTEACVEFVLMELIRTVKYQGNESILVGDGSCYILPISGEGNSNRVLRIESHVGEHTYRVLATIGTVGPKMTITSFERVVNF